VLEHFQRTLSLYEPFLLIPRHSAASFSGFWLDST
jgi:hypothetical protein